MKFDFTQPERNVLASLIHHIETKLGDRDSKRQANRLCNKFVGTSPQTTLKKDEAAFVLNITNMALSVGDSQIPEAEKLHFERIVAEISGKIFGASDAT